MPPELAVQLEAAGARRKIPNWSSPHSLPALLKAMARTILLAGRPVLSRYQVTPSSERNTPADLVPAQNLCGTPGSATTVVATSLTESVATGWKEAPPSVLRYTPSRPPTRMWSASPGSTHTASASGTASQSMYAHVVPPSVLRSMDEPTT